MASTKVRGITIELGADTSGIQSALKSVNASISQTSKELKDIDKLLKLDPTNTELLAQKQSALSKIIGDTREKMETLSRAMETLNSQMVDGGTEEQQRQMAALQREYVAAEQSLNKYEGQLESADKDIEEVSKDTAEASKHTVNFGDVAKKAGKIAAAAFAATAAAMAAVTKGLANMITDAAEYGDTIDDNSQKMGISNKAYQEWDFVLQHAGSSIDALRTSMKTLATAAESNNEAFEQLGISQEEIANLSQEELFGRVIEGLQNVESTTERTYLAGKLLGRGATELGGLLNMTAEETEEMKDQLHDLGGFLSDDAVKAASDFQDALMDLQVAFKGIQRGLSTQFLPSVTTVFKGLTQIFAGNKDEGLQLVREGINEAVKVVTDMMPEFISLAAEIILTLAQSIIENIPQALPAIIELVMGLVNTIIDNLPLFIDAAIQIIVAILQGIAQAMPDLIPAIVDAILLMVDTIIQNLPLIIEAALQIIVALITGLIEALPKLIEYLPTIIESIVKTLLANIGLIIKAGVQLLTALITNLPEIIIEIVKAAPEIIAGLVTGLIEGVKEMAEAGWELIRGLWQGIKDGAKWLWEKITGWLSDLWGGIKDFFGIKSPSKEMYWIGEMLNEGLANGIKDSTAASVSAATAMVRDVNSAMLGLNSGSVSLGLGGRALAASSGAGGNNITMNVYGAEGQDINVLADDVINRLQFTLGRSQAVYG